LKEGNEDFGRRSKQNFIIPIFFFLNI